MQYEIIIDVQGMAAINAIKQAFPTLSTRLTTPSFLAKRLPIDKWRYEATGRIIAVDLATLGDVLANIGQSFDTIRMGKVD